MRDDVESCMYIGKEEITISDEFLSLPYFREATKGYDWSVSLNPLIINAVHQDHVAVLPEDACI
jgi:hypothetical protein